MPPDAVALNLTLVPSPLVARPKEALVSHYLEFRDQQLSSPALLPGVVGAKQGGKVYVHCKAGRGRSATVVMGYLMKRYDLTPQEAQQRLVKVRPHVNPGLADRPVIKAYYDQLQAKKGATPLQYR